jgi:hypothetical protein
MILLGGDETLMAMHHYFRESSGGAKTSKMLNTERYRLPDSISSRVINHWEKEGIVRDPRTKTEGWRRYSLMDIIWLRMIEQSRTFNLGIPALRQMYESAIVTADTLDHSRYPLLELHVANWLGTQAPFSAIVTGKGKLYIAFDSIISAQSSMGAMPTHLCIPVHRILRSLLPKAPRKKASVRNALDEVFQFDFDSATIHKKNGKPYKVELQQSTRDKEVFESWLGTEPYQSTTVQEIDGRRIHFKRTISKRL